MTIVDRKQLGIRRFILIWGVLLWGVPSAVLFLIASHWGFNQPYALSQIVIALIIFPIGGIGFGAVMWRFLEAWELPRSKEISD